MQQLSSRDAAYLYLEDRHVSATVISAWVLGDPARGSTIDDDEIRARLRAMADLDEHLVCRAKFVPLSLGLPRWQRDLDFTVDRHYVRHEAGLTWEETTATLLEIGERPLPLDRPLWRAHLLPGVTGVPGQSGASTIMAIMWHHAAFDGIRWTHLTRHALADPSPERGPAPPTWSADDSQAGVARLMVGEIVRLPVTWGRFLIDLARRIGNRPTPVATVDASPDGPWPRTRFSASVQGSRVCSFVTLPLTAVSDVRRACPGATVNDVMLSVIGDALRLYLTEAGEAPESALSALVPISTRTGDDGPVNQFAASIVNVHTDVDDPLARVAAVSASATAAKRRVSEQQSIPPLELPATVLRLLGALSRSSRLNGTAAGPAVAITNVGPTRGVERMLGLPVDSMFGMQTLGSGCLLAHSIRTIRDRLAVSVTTDSEVMADPSDYLRCIERSLATHQAAAASV